MDAGRFRLDGAASVGRQRDHRRGHQLRFVRKRPPGDDALWRMTLGLQANADTGFAFSSWSGDCAGANPSTRLTLKWASRRAVPSSRQPRPPPPSGSTTRRRDRHTEPAGSPAGRPARPR
ncbi:MAG: hypothetical protein MZV49_25205 [Rhodopseudomonas palustris]|nr:hypothetical protein [Rhodopseudomonas palustris]